MNTSSQIMRRNVAAGGLLLCIMACFISQLQAADQKFDPRRWEENIAAMERQDRATPAPRDAILFVGSSSIVGWNVKASFPGRPVINRGFGGSHIADSIYYAPRIIFPCRPAKIVFYAGENDIAGGKSPLQVAEHFRQLVEKIRAVMPEVPIVFISLKPSPSRWKHIEQFRKTNELIRQYIATGKHLAYVDVETPMLGQDGLPRPELFVGDRLHLSAKGYELWTRLLTPHIQSVPATQPASASPDEHRKP